MASTNSNLIRLSKYKRTISLSRIPRASSWLHTSSSHFYCSATLRTFIVPSCCYAESYESHESHDLNRIVQMNQLQSTQSSGSGGSISMRSSYYNNSQQQGILSSSPFVMTKGLQQGGRTYNKFFSSSSSSSSSSKKSNDNDNSSIQNINTTIPKNNNNGSAINLISLIPSSTLQIIRTLPEVEQAISSLQTKTSISSSNSNNNITTLLDGLERASQIFQHVGKNEYISILLLKATLQSQHCQYQNAIHTVTTIVESQSEEDKNQFIYMSNLSKMHWYNGSIEKGLEYSIQMNDIAPTITTSLTSLLSYQVYLRQGCAMNAKALCTLLSLDDNHKLYDMDVLMHRLKKGRGDIHNNDMDNTNASSKTTLQEINDVHNTLKMASKILSNAFHQISNKNNSSSIGNGGSTGGDDEYLKLKNQLGLSSASSFCNQGIIDLLHAIIRNQVYMSKIGGGGGGGGGSNRISIDSAMNSWRQGINIIDELLSQSSQAASIDVQHEYLAKSLKAKLYCNMAWTILYASTYNYTYSDNNDDDDDDDNKEQKHTLLKEDELKIASEYSGLALKLYDEIIELGIQNGLGHYEELKPVMGRALGLVAACYAKAGSAVTAEGLLQSAMDLYKVDDIDYSKQQQQQLCPISQLDARSIYLTYASLCRNWEKRDADAKKNGDIALKIDEENLVGNWKGVSAIYSGLSFFAVTDF